MSEGRESIEHDEGPLIKLSEAAGLVPSRRGKKVSATTIWRWAKFGHRGVRLEAVRRPSGDWLTTRQAVVRFLRRVEEVQDSRSQEAQERTRPPRPAPADAWADAVLRKYGMI